MTTSDLDFMAAANARRPTILRGAGRGWPIVEGLSPERLAQYGDRWVDVEVIDQDGPTRVRLAEVLEEAFSGNAATRYLRGQLLSDLDPNLWQQLPATVRRLNWAGSLPIDVRPDWAWLMIGGRGSGSAWHVDVSMSSAWNLVTYGVKLWDFRPPADSIRHGLIPELSFHRDSPERLSIRQQPGDIVITPSGWLHRVANETGTVSVTGNFINDGNIDLARDYFLNIGDRASAQLLESLIVAFRSTSGRRA